MRWRQPLATVALAHTAAQILVPWLLGTAARDALLSLTLAMFFRGKTAMLR